MREIKETDHQLFIQMISRASQSTLTVCCVLHHPDFQCRLGIAYFALLQLFVDFFFPLYLR